MKERREFWIRQRPCDRDGYAEWQVSGPGVWLDGLSEESLSKFIHVREVLVEDKDPHLFKSCMCASYVEQIQALETKLNIAKDALLKADRYFKAKSGEYFCDVYLSEKSAIYGVDQALTKLEESK